MACVRSPDLKSPIPEVRVSVVGGFGRGLEMQIRSGDGSKNEEEIDLHLSAPDLVKSFVIVQLKPPIR
jgi:hypothetical protein